MRKNRLENKKAFSTLKVNFGAILEFLVLKMLLKRTYSISEMFDHLKNVGFETPLGSLYPLLTKFRNKKYIRSGYEEGDKRPVIKTYELVELGKQRLADLERDLECLNHLITSI